LEDEIGVDLLRRSPRGVTLTAEGKLFLDEVRDLLKRADESVDRVRALAIVVERMIATAILQAEIR
jgi:DNA-binding transcriptional LysR family regulator